MRRGVRRTDRGRDTRRANLVLVNQQLTGAGPNVTLSGPAPLPLNLTVTVVAGVLGVALISVDVNGVSLLTGVLSSALVQLGGGLTLGMSSGLYIGNSYTLVIP